MDNSAIWWLATLVVCVVYVTLRYPSTSAFDRPTHTAIGALSALAVSCLLLGYRRPEVFPVSTFETPIHAAIDGYLSDKRHKWTFSGALSRFDQRSRLLLTAFLALTLGALFRIEATHLLLVKSECAPRSWTPVVPLLYVSLEYACYQRTGSSLPIRSPKSPKYAPTGYGISPIALSVFGTLLLGWSIPRIGSTYFCPLAQWTRLLLYADQILLVFIDVIICSALSCLIQQSKSHKPKQQIFQFPQIIGASSIVLISCLLVQGFWLHWKQSEYRQWLAVLTLGLYTPDPIYTMALAMATFSSIQVYGRIRPKDVMMLMLLVVPMLISLRSAWDSQTTFIQPQFWLIQSATLILVFGVSLFMRTQTALRLTNIKEGMSKAPATPKYLMLALLGVYLTQLIAWSLQGQTTLSLHPIDVLIERAAQQHQDWKRQAFVSTDVRSAASEYRRRYKMNPPPRFDRWHSYSTYQGAKTLDDFDRIHEDLLPFWSMSPEEIRDATIELISNPYNFVGGVMIRKGRPQIAPFVPDTHRWMLEGVVDMIHPFSKWLPDMDVAFNLNDEPRVAVPYRELSRLQDAGRKAIESGERGEQDFLPRTRFWPAVPEEPLEDTPFHEMSFQNSFDAYGTVGCPPTSLALNRRHWQHDTLCVDCRAPHSLNQFLSNWTLASDPCHQPDLKYLHGFYSSPASLRNTNRLLPVFSQSKPQRYNDILYPSAWNYVDKVSYDPDDDLPDVEWQSKTPALFWRGATSEGYSWGNGAWSGFGRQRLVHMVNNATSGEESLVLLNTRPGSGAEQKSLSGPQAYHYASLRLPELQSHLQTDIHIVKDVARCRDSACDLQYQEFKPHFNPPIPFQSHWKYKYLMDMDGAGFSGRFLAFLQSKSLPFKASIMREWWDNRLTAWHHFVPLDIRLDELWSVLAYFAGWHGQDMATPLMASHDEQARKIAEAGREWANSVLTKEDMEAYFFRLLLEWARLTDDRRDTLGYAG